MKLSIQLLLLHFRMGRVTTLNVKQDVHTEVRPVHMHIHKMYMHAQFIIITGRGIG